jgi:hypothetical protein
MPPLLWLVAAACIFVVVLLAVCHLGAFVLSWRAGVAPSYAPVVRAVFGLTTVFVVPRVLPDPALYFGLLFVFVVWELAARMRQAGDRGERADLVEAQLTTHNPR